MTPTKTSNRSSAFGAGVKRMPTDSDDLDWSTPQENTPEVDDGVNLLSTLLLSLILKLEDREYRVKKDRPARRRAKSADESSDRSRQRCFDDYDNAGALVMREDFTQWDYSSDSNTEDIRKVDDDDHHDAITEWRNERSHFPNDPTRPNYNQITQRDSLTGSSSSGLSRVRSDVSEDMLTPSSHTSEDDVTLTSLCKQGEGSVYRDSAVHIVGDALLRAIANIFSNGVIRRGVRTYGLTIWSLTDYQHSTISHGYIGQPRIPTLEGMRQIKPKPGRVSSEWLDDVNRRIAAPEVTTVSEPDSMPPSVASSCNVSRCSSVDILSSGDRALKVKAIHPSQSKLLWRAVQKSHGSDNVKKPVDEPDLTPVFVPVYDGSSTKEKKVELSKALERVRESTPRKRFWGEKLTDVETIEDGTCLKVDRLVKFRDSAAQTGKTDLQKDSTSACDDDVTDYKEKKRGEAKSPPYSIQTDERVTTDRLVKCRDSAAQTEKADLQKDGKSTCDDDVTDNKEKIGEAKSPLYSVQTDERVTTEVDRLVRFRDSAAQTEKADLQKDSKSTCDDDVTDYKEKIGEAKSPPYSVQTDERVTTEVDRLVKFRDSAAQTEKTDLQKDGKLTCDDDVTDNKEKIREAKSPPYSVQTDERVTTEVSTAQTNQAQEPSTLQVKQQNVPPIASPLLMDVVWRHASDNDMTDQEKINFKAHFARGGARETERAKGVVKSAVRRAVSEVFVDRVISDSLESLTSLGELRITPSFKKAAADLTQGPPLQFEWFPYLEGSAGPFKVTDRRRQRADRIGEAKIQPNIMGVSEPSEVYEDAQEKFGSPEDLKGQVNSSEDEFTDAVCESDCAECHVSATKPSTIDKATQVSHTAYGEDSSSSPSDDIEDEQQSPAVQLELPMESINYIKDQFEDVKVLVAKYRELLYEPLDESVPVGSRAQPEINPDEEQTSDLRDVNTLQIKPGLDETDEDDDDVARKPKRKHTKDEKDIKQAEEKSTKIEKQSEKLTKDKAKEKTEKGKKENKDSFLEGREAALANQDISNKDEDNAALTHEQQVADQHPKVKDKRKKRDDSPTRDKTSVRRTLRKTGDKMRTPTGRQRFGKTVLEKTTGDGFLSLKVKVDPDNSLESEMKTGTNELLKSGATSSRKAEDKLTTPLKPTGEDKPKVKNHISFFEKFSKHSLKRSDQTTPSSNSPSPEPDTTIKREAQNVDTLERFSHSESMKQNDEMKRKGKDSSKRDKQVNPESCVDSSPGKGIWTNRAFFEALSESDDQTVLTSEPPKTAKRILEDGLLDEPGNKDGQPGPSLKTKKEISRRERSPTTSPEKTDEKRKSPSSRRKKKSRNKNTNNEVLIDQVTTDDSCISDSQCSCADTTVNANGKIVVDGLLSSSITNCDDDTITKAKNTTTCHNSRSDEVEITVQTTEIIPKLSSGRLNIDEAETTEDRRNSSSPCGDSRIENEDDAVLLHNITPHQRLSSERVNGEESTTTETRCVSSSPRSDTETEKEEALLSHNVTPRQRLSSENLNSGKASISKSPSNHIEPEIVEDALKSNEIIFDQKTSSESLPCIDGPSGGHSHFQMDHDQDKTNTVDMKENIFKKSQSTESVTEYEPQTTEIKTNYGITTDLDDDSAVLKTQNHHTHIGQAISVELTEEDNATSVDDLLDDLSLNGDLSREVQIHSPPPTGEIDDVSSLNNLDVPLLTSSPHPHRRPKKSNTSSMESIEKGGVPDQTPPILRNNNEEVEEDVNDGDEDSGDDFLHHLRNTSFLLACNPDCYMSKDQPNQDVQTEEDMDKRKTQDEQEKITSNRPMENPQSQSEIQQDGVNTFKVSAQPKIELRSNVCQAMISDGEQEAGSKVNSPMLESERRKHGEQKSCLRFSLLRKSKKRSRSKKTSLGQSEGKQQPSSDSDCIPQDETHTASKVEEEDAVAVVTKECTNEGVDTSTDSNPTPPGSQKRKFRLKYLRRSKKQKASSKT